ncbi:unnamed protein product [Camellia sinensis]
MMMMKNSLFFLLCLLLFLLLPLLLIKDGKGSKQVSREGKALSSTPTETATETDWSEKKKTVKASRERNVDLLAFKKMTIHHDEDVISQSKPR